MSKYTIISGTNREDSYTEKVSHEYQKLLKEKNVEACVLSLKNMDVLAENEALSKIEVDLLFPTEKFIFIIPEYHGSYPGVLKAMFDINNVKKCYWWKKALLTGVSTGRAGNLRGMEHLTGVLNHMKMIVHPNKLPISVVDTLLDDYGAFEHAPTLMAIHQQLDEFIKF
jgi:chromate reductase, NAD(P)H dehydrogenase (quinone)